MKKRKTNQKLAALGKIGLFLIIITLIAVLNLRDSPTMTGSSIYIRTYGTSHEPMKTIPNSVQTSITLKQPFLLTLETPEGKTRLIDNIIENAGLPPRITNLYQTNPAVPILPNTLEEITALIKNENDNFRSNGTCLKKIGETYGHWGEFNIFLISELKYQKCTKTNQWYSIYVKHSFFNQEGNRFLCNQNSDPLFLVRVTDGKIGTDFKIC